MVADSITDSELFHGSPVFAKKSKTNRLNQWKNDAFCNQWIDYEEGSYGFTKFDDDEIDLENTSSSVLKEGSVDEDWFCCSNPMPEEELDDVYNTWGTFWEALNFSDNDENPQFEIEDLEQEEDPMTPIKTSDNDNVENPQLEAEDMEQEEEEDSIIDTIWRRNNITPRKLFQDNKRVKPPETSSEETIERKGKKMKKMESNSEKQEDDKVCSFCSEVIDATDLIFKPCPCGFRVCLKCHRMISENEGRCPACKREYDEKSDEDGMKDS